MRKKGFTIIEVSLVLAIAGMILLLAFIALPGLQRSQRDSRRKDDIMKLADSIKKYQSNNNRGVLPASENELNKVVDSFIGSDFLDPDGTAYNLKWDKCESGVGKKCTTAMTNVSDSSDKHNMLFVTGATCNDDNEAVGSANQRKGAILYKLEISDLYCYEL